MNQINKIRNKNGEITIDSTKIYDYWLLLREYVLK